MFHYFARMYEKINSSINTSTPTSFGRVGRGVGWGSTSVSRSPRHTSFPFRTHRPIHILILYNWGVLLEENLGKT